MLKNKKIFLILILIIAAVFRIYGLPSGDTLTDESYMSFRSLGLMDFAEMDAQTTPWEWFDPGTVSNYCENSQLSPDKVMPVALLDRLCRDAVTQGNWGQIPWWAKISFHDHPLFVPLIEKISMLIFGESNFGFRLPSALVGIASVYIIFLLGRMLFSVNAGLYAAALLAVTVNNIYISRLGMQEAYVIFFLLLGSYFFLRSLKEEKYLLWAAIAIGLGAEAKYNSLILIPIFITYLLIFRRDYFKNKYFYYGILAFILIFSPTIIYNLKLYQTAGHFDFQFSYIFGQHPEVWKIAPGKEIGSLAERVKNFIPRLIATNSWVFLSLTALSLFTFCFSLFKNFKETLLKNAFLLLSTFYLITLLLLIGPSYRFLTMITPFFALSAGIFINNAYSLIRANKRIEKIGFIAIALILIFEIFYSINNQIIYYPIGPTPWLSSKVRYENYNWGYNELGEWLEKELKGKMPALTFNPKYKFLEQLRDQAIEKGLAKNLIPYPSLFIYDGNFDKAGKLWSLDRLHIYHGWPIISVQTYFDYLQENGFDYYYKTGFKNYYFILQNNIAPSPASQSLIQGIPIKIKNPRGDEAFNIYKF